jgi:hypothetical protein
MFLLLGPLIVTIAVLLAIVTPGSGVYPEIVALMAAVIFMGTLPLSALVGVIDSRLARRFPVLPRAGLTAVAGAVGACVPVGIYAYGTATASMLLYFVICGAASMLLCALLAGGPGRRPPPQGYAAALRAKADE